MAYHPCAIIPAPITDGEPRFACKVDLRFTPDSRYGTNRALELVAIVP